MLIDPEGYVVWGTSGEITFEQVDAVLEARPSRTTASKGCWTRRRCASNLAAGSTRRPRRCGSPARSWPTSRAGGCSSPTATTTASSSPRLDGTLLDVDRLRRRSARRTAISPPPSSTSRRAWPCRRPDALRGRHREPPDPQGRPGRAARDAPWPARAGRPASRPLGRLARARGKIALSSPWDLWHPRRRPVHRHGRLPPDLADAAGRLGASAPTPATAARTSSTARCCRGKPYQAGLRLVRPAQRAGLRRHAGSTWPTARAARSARSRCDPRKEVRTVVGTSRSARRAAVHLRRRRRPGRRGPVPASAGRGVLRRAALRGRHLQQQDQGGRSGDGDDADAGRHRQARLERRSRPSSTSRPASGRRREALRGRHEQPPDPRDRLGRAARSARWRSPGSSRPSRRPRQSRSARAPASGRRSSSRWR